MITLDSTIGLLKNALSGASTAHGFYANDLANVNTPNYHRTNVSFKSQLAEAAGLSDEGGELTMSTSHPDDLTASASTNSFAPDVEVDDTTTMRTDGNNVDVDQEMAELSMNADYSAMGSQFLRNAYANYHQILSS